MKIAKKHEIENENHTTATFLRVLYHKREQEMKQTNFRQWKSGKHWLYAATALAILIGGGSITSYSFPKVPVLQGIFAAQTVHADAISDYNTASAAYQTALNNYTAASNTANQAVNTYNSHLTQIN